MYRWTLSLVSRTWTVYRKPIASPNFRRRRIQPEVRNEIIQHWCSHLFKKSEKLSHSNGEKTFDCLGQIPSIINFILTELGFEMNQHHFCLLLNIGLLNTFLYSYFLSHWDPIWRYVCLLMAFLLWSLLQHFLPLCGFLLYLNDLLTCSLDTTFSTSVLLLTSLRFEYIKSLHTRLFLPSGIHDNNVDVFFNDVDLFIFYMFTWY